MIPIWKTEKPVSKRGLCFVHIFPYKVRNNPREWETSTIKQVKRNKRHKDRKEVKLLVDNITVYIKNPKKNIKQLLVASK